ncbi:LysM peptidoglycan-binding domain-containing protein [Chitinimonas sp. BJB300]|uniref:LysM peptidoglycan-binding domain-containing protein n=1 Tax=Chitinimonas sp. BJB300 TaxID=1559339 RepID=UPI000C117CE6|nr:LysM peptidoglycan-binding domain-containing protein [Chitinimonas sp. BJB300]PHV11132.1 peptidoglycan-binding protein [Chitinimonas sp. BJB300]TSJ90980.1 LysM peptidoglycan-binding domain-containing protein [Chitinimonas sp. BJB300]
MPLPATRTSLISRLISGAIIALTITFPAIADELRLQDNAPERYVVVKGDTLWDISGKFLKDPWRWPQIWNMNRDEIKNPHWIYPGDVIVLDTSGGSPRLRLLGNKNNDGLRANMKLDPRIRITQFDSQAAATIPAQAIEPYLSKPLIVDEQSFKNAPRVALGPDNHVVMSTGDTVYAVNLTGNRGETWQAFSGGKEILDPDTKELLGYQVNYVGDADVLAVDEVSTLKVQRVVQEVSINDRLILKPRREFPNYVPRVPDTDVRGKVISTYGGVNDAGPYTTVVINKGEREGIVLGHVLQTFKAPREVRKESKSEPTKLAPAEKNGFVFIYQVFPKLAYGLVLNSTQPVNLLDEVRNP